MRIVNTTSVYKPNVDLLFVMKQLKKAGFTYLDLGGMGYRCEPVNNHIFLTDQWKQWAYKLRDFAENEGMSFVQCHGVGWISSVATHPDHIAYRVVDLAAMLDVRWVVMHPVEIQGRQEPCDDEFFAEQNAEWFKPFLQYCEERDVGLAIENLPWPNANRVAPLKSLVERLDSSNVGICWDTGHAHYNVLHGELPPQAIREFGSQLVTIHAHDNFGNHDDHMIPGQGTYDWQAFMQTLREMNYTGDFVLEAHHQTQEASSEEERMALLVEMRKAAERIIM
ncbi:MAG: sugar phosphate isomerase/epimerase [Clostridia bacterium]|nr:sugar phosphate isomerase/epimerase [Clostridia bacterium]